MSIRNWKKAKEREAKWRIYVVMDWNMFSAPRKAKCEFGIWNDHPSMWDRGLIHCKFYPRVVTSHHVTSSTCCLQQLHSGFGSNEFRIWSCEFHPDVYRWGEYWFSDCHKYTTQPYLVLSGEQKDFISEKKDTFIVLIWKLMEHSSFCIWQYLSVAIKLWRILWNKR